MVDDGYADASWAAGNGDGANWAGADDGLAARQQALADGLWYLEAATAPADVLANLLAVLSLANALVHGEQWDSALAAVYQAWSELAAESGHPELWTAARDTVVQHGWQLDGVGRADVTQLAAELGVLAQAAADAHAQLTANAAF